MAQTGYTPISIYYSSTAAATPTAGNLVAGELAINTADGKLFYKDSAGVVQVIAGKGGAGVAGGSNTQVQYNSSGSLAGSANMTFSGTALTLANDASISGLTVGKGGGAVSGNVLVNTSALASNTTGSNLVAVGDRALNANTTGNGNSAYGYLALYANTTGGTNTGLGGTALIGNTTGSSNTAVGYDSLRSNTTASNNTAVGYQAGYSNTVGAVNTFIGYQAAYSNVSGNNSVVIGRLAGYSATISAQNTFVGAQAGYSSNITAGGNGYNTFIGYGAGYSATTGYGNTFVGSNNTLGTGAGYSMTTGNANTILGGFTGNQGGLDIRTASNYIVLSDGDGNPLVTTYNGGTTALKGAVPNAGTGITFPATQSASSDANTLDDYEEGTWSPFLGASTTDPTVTYNSNGRVGYYTKVGRVVYFTGFLSIATKSGGSGDLLLSGLPFTCSSSARAWGNIVIGSSGINWGSGKTMLSGYAQEGGNAIYWLACANDAAWAGIPIANVVSGDELIVSGWYQV